MNSLINILLVDDDARNLDALESVLASPELRLVRAQSPEDALLSLVNDEFACIVLDVQMPGMSGIELSRVIKTRKRNQHIPIIFLTAYFLEEKDILQGYGAGAVDYLTKPINPQILKSKVGVFVDLFKTARALADANAALELEVGHRKTAEDALRAANNELEMSGQKMKWQLAAIVESSDDAIIGKDTNGIITSWNRGAEALFGYAAGEVIGKPITVLIPPERINEEDEILARIRRGEHILHYETVRRRKDGTLLDISLTISPIKDASGKIIGASKIARDITDRKRIEEELKHANEELLAASRAKDDFLATLSHELRTPLNPVLLIASDAANNRDLAPGVRMDFDSIRKNVELEARLIDDLLDLTRITHGKILLDKHLLDVHSILQSALANVQEEIGQKKIMLDVKLTAQQCCVFADEVRLQQVFWNLFKNAVKFTPQGGHITVETEVSNENQIVIRITDTGIGVEPGEMDGIFNAFSQGDHAQRFGGLGLGLAISKRLLEFHSGEIRAASKGLNQGATFTVKLPLAKLVKKDNPRVNGAKTSFNEFLPDKSSENIRILLVEDHEPTRTTLARLLARRRYEVVTAASIAEALACQQDFRVLISDIGLPDGSGYDLMIEMRKRGFIQGIALTGFGMEQDVARSQEAGFFTHLTKPVKIQSLENALSAAVKLTV
jgi:PAS domain S-box-containing protein